jgi:hypothetical protein
VDPFGRVCLPRGVNMSGASKTFVCCFFIFIVDESHPGLEDSPTNHDSSKFPTGHEDVTFVGRPFPLEDAPEHFARLRRWGLTFGV